MPRVARKPVPDDVETPARSHNSARIAAASRKLTIGAMRTSSDSTTPPLASGIRPCCTQNEGTAGCGDGQARSSL